MNIIREIQKRWFPKTLKCVYRKDILEYALKHHRYTYSAINHGGLCVSISDALIHYGLYSIIIIDIAFPLFTNDNARLFNARCCKYSHRYWWQPSVWDTGRLDFLKWLLEQYKNDKTNLKEFKYYGRLQRKI